jgi:hypothetical protein
VRAYLAPHVRNLPTRLSEARRVKQPVRHRRGEDRESTVRSLAWNEGSRAIERESERV